MRARRQRPRNDGMHRTWSSAARWLRWALPALVLLGLIYAAPGSRASPVTPRSASSAPIAITTDGATLAVVNPDSNSLTLVDAATRIPQAEIPVGVDPRAVALSADDTTAYVVNQGAATLSVVDLASLTVDTVPTGDRPVGAATSPDGRFLAIAEMGDDRIRFLDTGTLRTLSTIPVADRPYGLAFTPDSRHLLVTHLHTGDVTLLPVRPFILHLPLLLQQLTTTLERSNVLTFKQPALSLSQGSNAPPALLPTWPNVAPAPAVTVNAAGTRAYLPQTMANGLGLNTGFDTTVFPKVSVLDLDTLSHTRDEHIPLPEVDRPVGLPWAAALAREDTELWVVNAASNDLSVIDIADAERPQMAAHIPVGDNPRGVVLSPDGRNAYVANSLAGTVSVIDAHVYTVTQAITVTGIPLPPTLLHGKRLYHSSARPELAQAAWISCNTCHVEGEHDGRTWLLQYDGPVPPGARPVITRNTTSLLGMVETYPLRWSAEWDESADSEFSVRFEQFGSGLIDGEMHPTLGPLNQGRSYDLDCLAAFIDSLAVPARARSLSPAAVRGRAVFESPETACAQCHPAPLYTDLQVHDVGTADAYGEWFGPLIDTPTLRFLYDSAPYLHDGSAATLHDVLAAYNPDDEHGVTSHLTAQELDDLIAFLLALPYE